MNKLFLKLNGEGSKEVASHVITVSQWLNKDPKVKGYSDPETVILYAKSLRAQEIEQLEQFFNYVRNGVRIIGSLVTRKDRSNRSYQHPTFLNGRSSTGTKVILEAGMKDFLNDYMEGKVSINFTLEELVEEALNG